MIRERITNEIRPHCGEIWMCNLITKDGSIQSGYRPVFILSNDKNNTYSTTLNIIPITSKMNKKKPWKYEFLCWGQNKVYAMDEWAKENKMIRV